MCLEIFEVLTVTLFLKNCDFFFQFFFSVILEKKELFNETKEDM